MLFDTLEKFQIKELDTAAAIAKKFKWRYHNSKGKFCSREELNDAACSVVYAAIGQYKKNVDAGKPRQGIMCGSGRFYARVEFFESPTPIVSLSYGIHSETR